MASRLVSAVSVVAQEAERRRQLWRLWLAAALLLSLMSMLRPGAQRGAVAADYGSSHPSGYGPNQLVSAYDVQPLHRQGLNGQGQTLAFIEIDGIDSGDLTHFDNTYHLPSAQLKVFVPKGTNGALDPGPETTLDLEYAHAIAPAARLEAYEVIRVGDFVNYSGALADAVRAALAGGATEISISLRGTGSIICSTKWASRNLHAPLQEAANHGVAVFSASGDDGDLPCNGVIAIFPGTVYPASDPNVTAVGGTTLTVTRSGSYGGEVAWSGSGGGISTDFKRPSWEVGSSNIGSDRGVPDVAWDADPASGVPVYFQGSWSRVGGTSLGSPCWAALWALASQYHHQRTGKNLGFANPLIYKLATGSSYHRLFHDVTSGNNGSYQAGPGWDAVTGWGSPDANNLVHALTP
jgi:kumamolisin